ncbi:MAG: 4-phosphopantetheinyl transferase [Pseudomonadota bacterium]
MIIGIGTDVLRIPRIEELYLKSGNAFAKRILADSELEEYEKNTDEKKPYFLAKRFAAKEAIAKALGVGIGSRLSFLDIAIKHDDLGKPIPEIKRDIAKGKNILLSISDDFPIVVAFAVVSL